MPNASLFYTSGPSYNKALNPLLSGRKHWGACPVAPNPAPPVKAWLSGRLACQPQPPNEPKLPCRDVRPVDRNPPRTHYFYGSPNIYMYVKSLNDISLIISYI